MVPGNGERYWVAPYGMVGAMRTSDFSSMSSRMRFGIRVSVPRGIWVPWHSMEPMARMTMSFSLKYCSACGQVSRSNLIGFPPCSIGQKPDKPSCPAPCADDYFSSSGTTAIASSARDLSSTKSGQLVISSLAFCTFGKAITSRMFSVPVMIMIRRSRP